jgi:hypothetical protein
MTGEATPMISALQAACFTFRILFWLFGGMPFDGAETYPNHAVESRILKQME